MQIPKIVHNIWIQGWDSLPNEIKNNRNKIIELNKDWNFILWDNEMILNILKLIHPMVY
jgi:mannosyltransferase OCH1-like enzyme